MPDILDDFLAKKLEEREYYFGSNEMVARLAIILPVLSRLGWNVENVQEVIPEFSAGGGQVDFCLCLGAKHKRLSR